MKPKSNLAAGHFTLLMPQGGTGDNPFPVPPEATDAEFIQSAPPGEEGRVLVRKHRQNVFLRAHGQAREVLRKKEARLGRKCGRLEKEYKRASEAAAKTNQTVLNPRPSLKMPNGRERWGTVGWGLVLVSMAVFTWVNAARFAANETQDWLLAFLYAAPLLYVPFGLKFIDDKVSGEARFYYWVALVLAFTASLALFEAAFAWHFGSAGSLEPGSGAVVSLGADMRAQLLGQLILDPLLALAVYTKFRESLRTGAEEITNPDWEARMKEAGKLEDELDAVSSELARYAGLLVQLERALEAFMDDGESLWRRVQEERREAGRDQEEEEKDYRERQKRRQEREEKRWRWPAAGDRHNGKSSSSSN